MGGKNDYEELQSVPIKLNLFLGYHSHGRDRQFVRFLSHSSFSNNFHPV